MAALRMPPPSPSSTSSDQPPTSPISRIGTGRGFPKNELAKFRSPPLLCRPAAERRQPSNAKIAQLVEQLAFNQLVLGSSPSLRTSFPNSLRVRTSGISKLYGFPRYASKRASLPHRPVMFRSCLRRRFFGRFAAPSSFVVISNYHPTFGLFPAPYCSRAANP